ncbi:ABC transporter permease [Devosia sp. 919]|uniref:ABC transporter permease subunit n=1 Tax=Devosia sp. 919 TaxID=2726065 RepID=UPI00155593C7
MATDASSDNHDAKPDLATPPAWTIRRVATADWSSAVFALVFVVAVVGCFHPNFLAPNQLINVVQSSVYAALIAAGLVFLIPQNEIDLSVGGNYVLTGIVAALLMKAGLFPLLAIVLALLVAMGIGLLNAFTSQVIGIPSLIGTLAMSWMLRGLALALAGGTQVTGVPLSDPIVSVLGGGRVLGLPVSIILLIVVGVVLTLVMRNTPFGYRVRQIGSNPDAAEFSGIPVRRTRTLGFVLAGFMAGLAGIVALTFFTVGDPQSGGGIELFAVAGAVIGGTPLAGGKATVFGAMVGAILLTAVAVGLVYFQIPATWAQFATGAVILGAVSVDGLVQRQRRRADQKD